MKLLIIGVCIGFVVGNIIGVVMMACMAAASREDRAREYNELLNEHTQELTEMVEGNREHSKDYKELINELDKVYISLNDHMLAVAPDETTPDSEYDLRKGIAIGVQQSLNSLVHLWKPEEEVVDEYSKIMFKGKCPYTSKECEKWTCRSCKVEKAERELYDA